eukprot:scaffold28127_cov139-Skeletonema_dohrnii-CCMP3373.AAC.2
MDQMVGIVGKDLDLDVAMRQTLGQSINAGTIRCSFAVFRRTPRCSSSRDVAYALLNLVHVATTSHLK